MFRFIFLFIFLLASIASADESDKWEGYLEFTGKPGTTRSLGVSDLFVPLWQDRNDLTFLNVRGHVDFGSDANEYNIGFGHRHMYENFILGAYGYYDNTKSDNGYKYDQWTFGAEMLGEKWDIRANYYMADENINEQKWDVSKITSSVSNTAQGQIQGANVFVNHSQTTSTTTSTDTHTIRESSLSGIDGEVGYKIFPALLEDARVYVGGYHFFGKDGFNSVSGPRLRLETRIHDLSSLRTGSRLMLGLETQYDNVRGSQTSGLLSLRIPFGIGTPQKRLVGLDRRMMEPVVRDIDIVTGGNNSVENTVETTSETQSETTDALNPEDLAYTKVMQFDTDTTMDNIIELVEAEIANGELPLVIIETADGTEQFIVTDAAIPGQSTFAMAGVSLEVGYFNAFDEGINKVSFMPEGDTPEQVYGTRDVALNLSPRAHVNGFDIDATNNKYGLNLTEEGNYWVTNTNIRNAESHGVYVHSVNFEDNSDFVVGEDEYELSQTVLYLYDTRDIPTMEISGNRGFGIRVGENANDWTEYQGGTVFASDLLIEANGWVKRELGYNPKDDPDYVYGTSDYSGQSNVGVTGQWAYLDIKNSTVSYSPQHGLTAGEGGIIFADNLQVFYNGHDGVDSNYADSGAPSYINIKNSSIYGNYYGLIANRGGIVVADNVVVSENQQGGVFAEGTMRITNSFILNNEKFGITAFSKIPSLQPDIHYSAPPYVTTVFLDNVVISGTKSVNSNFGYGVKNHGGHFTIINSIIEDSGGANFLNIDGGTSYLGNGTIFVNGCVISAFGEFEVCVN